jgi:hypothetical protein
MAAPVLIVPVVDRCVSGVRGKSVCTRRNMNTTSKQDNDFIKDVICTSLLEESIDWIVSHLSAEEVYGKDVMEEWAEDNGYVMKEDE